MNDQIARAILAAGFFNYAGLQAATTLTALSGVLAGAYFAWTALHKEGK